MSENPAGSDTLEQCGFLNSALEEHKYNNNELGTGHFLWINDQQGEADGPGHSQGPLTPASHQSPGNALCQDHFRISK